MPRVGSSTMRMSLSRSSQRPMMTFCWFPPDSRRTVWWIDGVRMDRLRTCRSAISSSAAPFTIPRREFCGRFAMAMLSLTVFSSSSPLPLRSSER